MPQYSLGISADNSRRDPDYGPLALPRSGRRKFRARANQTLTKQTKLALGWFRRFCQCMKSPSRQNPAREPVQYRSMRGGLPGLWSVTYSSPKMKVVWGAVPVGARSKRGSALAATATSAAASRHLAQAHAIIHVFASLQKGGISKERRHSGPHR